MRYVILAAIAGCAAAAASAAPVAGPAGPPRFDVTDTAERCRTRPDVIPAGTLEPPAPHRLVDQPPGDTILAVYREVDGCPVPVIVRYGDGRGPDPTAPTARPRVQARLYR